MTTLPKPAEFAVPPEQFIRGLLEIAKGEERTQILLLFISKNLTAAREVLDAVTIATLTAELNSLSAPSTPEPEPEPEPEPQPEPRLSPPAAPQRPRAASTGRSPHRVAGARAPPAR